MIHAVGAERGLDHEGIHAVAVDKLGATSLNVLTIQQRAELDAIVRDLPLIEQPEQEPAKGVAADAETAPAPVSPPSAEPEPSLDEATIAVAQAAGVAGLDASWPALDQLARDALSKEPEAMTVADWVELRIRIEAGAFQKAAAG